MKILSINLERPKINQAEKLNSIKELIFSENPDIIFLTETNLVLEFGTEYFSIQSKELPGFHDNQNYKEKENRVSIFSKYPFVSLSSS